MLQAIILNTFTLGVIEPISFNPLTIYSTISVNNRPDLSSSQNNSAPSEAKALITLPQEVVRLSAGSKIYSYVFQSDVLFISRNNVSTSALETR